MIKTKKMWYYTFALFGATFMLFSSCEKDDDDNTLQTSTPVLTTAEVTEITQTTATSGGNITADGGATVTARGVCWSTNQNPTINDSKTEDGTGAGSFTSNITGLESNTIYYVRAYATNSAGTAYGAQVSMETTGCSIVYGAGVTDIDGNTYQSVIIGTQEWMSENLKTTKYRDGSNIPNITDNGTWAGLSTGAYAWYDNDIANKPIYGALYNWYAVETGNLCPTGWHVPSDAEWTVLTDFLGGESIAGGKLKATSGWSSPNTGATNETGFTALPGGYRYGDGSFLGIGGGGFWWGATEGTTSIAWYRFVDYGSSNVYRYYGGKEFGFSVRCLRY